MNLLSYLGKSNQEKFDYFMATRTKTNHTPSYWVDWQKINRNMSKYRPKLAKLDCLAGQEDIMTKARQLFKEQPDLLNVVPILLGTHEHQLDVMLNIDNAFKTYTLDFNSPDLNQLDRYLTFMQQTGLFNFMANISEPLANFVYGIEIGLDTNARKNRSGFQNEAILAQTLNAIKHDNPNLEVATQITGATVKKQWHIEVPEPIDKKRVGGRIYDGAIFNKITGKVTIIETNFYNSNGSKLKAVAGEFSNVFEYINSHNSKQVNFVWISDGCGWDQSKNPLREAFDIIPNIFNLQMVQKGYLAELVNH